MAEPGYEHKIDSFSTDGVRRRGSASRTLFGDIIQFIDFIIVIFTSVAVAQVYHVFILGTEIDLQNYAAAGIMGATGLTALLRRDGYYEFDQIASASKAVRAIISRWALVLLGLLAFGFALKISDNFSRVWLTAWSGAALISVIAVRYAASVTAQRMSKDGGVFARRVAVVGATSLGVKFVDYATSSPAGISIVGIYDAGLVNNGWRTRSPYHSRNACRLHSPGTIGTGQ